MKIIEGEFAICTVGVAPLRIDATSTSEMVNQILFGEIVAVQNIKNDFVLVKAMLDDYIGYVSSNQIAAVDNSFVTDYEKNLFFVNDNYKFARLKSNENIKVLLTKSCKLPYFENNSFKIGNKEYIFEGIADKFPEVFDINLIKKYIPDFIGTPYLWGGRTNLGIDCSGLSQTLFALCGKKIPRNARTQINLGEVVHFLEEAQFGDLAFFGDEEENITHVGIIIDSKSILHSSGITKIEEIDSFGIINRDTNSYSHVLKVIKRIQ